MRPVTPPTFRERKAKGEKIAMLTAYDYPCAELADAAGVDAILVGDSCAMAVMGRPNTLTVTLEEMLHHVRMVSGAVTRALVVADMPFLSYHVSAEDTMRNAGRLVTEGGAQALKLEGPVDRVGDKIAAIRSAGIPVMGHVGLTPQSILDLGGYKVQGREAADADRIKNEAKALQDAGCFAVVLECIPPELARDISQSLAIPTIGIGAGSQCDGQILVMHDMLGWGKTRFTKTYADVRGQMEQAFRQYVADVRDETFPAKQHEYG